MKKEIADKWVAALRSGEYKQTTGALRKGDRFCCLGVLSELAVKEGVILPAEKDSYNLYNYCGSTGFLSSLVMDWAGIKQHNGSFYNITFGKISLSVENDAGKSFSQIAGLIEQNWEKL